MSFTHWFTYVHCEMKIGLGDVAESEFINEFKFIRQLNDLHTDLARSPALAALGSHIRCQLCAVALLEKVHDWLFSAQEYVGWKLLAFCLIFDIKSFSTVQRN